MSRVIKFGPHIRELRLHLCQTGGPSSGVRDFIEKNYVSLKQANPTFPILVRECSGILPRLWARYGAGRETSVSLSNLSADEVWQQVQNLSREANYKPTEDELNPKRKARV